MRFAARPARHHKHTRQHAIDPRNHEVRQVILRQSRFQLRWQQEGLIPIVGNEIRRAPSPAIISALGGSVRSCTDCKAASFSLCCSVVARHEMLRFQVFQKRVLARRRQRQPSDTWHLDEVFIRIRGVLHDLWRAVEQCGIVLHDRSGFR